MKKAIFVLGLKWLDKVNGNTYNNAVIYYDNGDSEAIGYEYGYDDDYYNRALKHLKDNNIDYLERLPHAHKWTKKVHAKNGYDFD